MHHAGRSEKNHGLRRAEFPGVRRRGHGRGKSEKSIGGEKKGGEVYMRYGCVRAALLLLPSNVFMRAKDSHTSGVYGRELPGMLLATQTE
jgi:hypothetical protein